MFVFHNADFQKWDCCRTLICTLMALILVILGLATSFILTHSGTPTYIAYAAGSSYYFMAFLVLWLYLHH
ncbi:hypothetical protein JTE90_015128 [Oedothorax gibbosus]|uniref:Uncharacterized protein n=1 Tax=Oedothorax gibbosus TaxID=931172 RepID=A0AAV6VT15_9ARAC|nr:hypothetical protein JTE90_015128 [Oedothorax gibbosus]